MPTIFLNKNQYASNGGKEMVLTQTQYDNLSEQDKMNGMTYYICDADSDKNGDFQPIIYSTNEREVGVWCDGKPLYQKTVFPSISEINAHSFSDSDFADAEMIMIIDGYYTLTNNYLKVALNQYETSSYWCRAGFRNDKSIYLYVNGYSVTGSASITIRYTKTTDTPGSGSWTPGGVPAHHYSTDEQIVGTWIDGNTLYEKTTIAPNFSTTISEWGWYGGQIDISSIILNISQSFPILEKSYITLGDTTTRQPCYIDCQVPSSPVVYFPGSSRSGTLTLTIQYTKTSS